MNQLRLCAMDSYPMIFLMIALLTGMSLQSPVIHDRSPINNDLVHCVDKLITELCSGVSAVITFGTSRTSIIDHILHDLFQSDPPIPVIRANRTQMDRVYFERVWLAAVDDRKELESVMHLLRDVHHQRIIICLTYVSADPLHELREAASSSQIKALTRNVMFVATNREITETWIMAAPEYSQENCRKLQIIQVGVCHRGTLVKHIPTWTPKVNDLAGCQLSVALQPLEEPYVENQDDNQPGGYTSEIVEALATMMNFTPKYVWLSSVDDVLSHTVENDLNLLFDMRPELFQSKTAASFSIGMVHIGFYIQRKPHHRSLYFLFLAPFNMSVWLTIAGVMCTLLGASFLLYHQDPSTIMFKIGGSLLGVAVSKFPKVQGINVFLVFWLLPSYFLTQVYLANLTKEFTVPAEGKSIHTLKELMDSKHMIMCTEAERRAFRDSSLWPVGLSDHCQLVTEDYSQAFSAQVGQNGVMNNTAMISSLELLEGTRSFTKFQVINDHLLQKRQLVSVHSGNLYVTAMEKNYNRLFASGLTLYWKELQLSKHQTIFKHTEPVSDLAFILHSVGFLVIGLSMSFMCLLAELIIYQIRERKR